LVKFKTLVCSSTVFLFLTIGCLSAFGHGDVNPLLEDVNDDGVVNILDLVLVAHAFGQPVDRDMEQNPDVNRDGVTNILDLVRVANRLGERAAVDNSTYHDLQDYIFTKSCTASYCHAAPTNAGNLNLTSGVSYQDLVGRVPQNLAAVSAGMKRVDPGNPDNSFLLTKLAGLSTPAEGGRMPLGEGPLHSGKIDAIRKWIAAGAPRNEKLTGIGDLSLLRDPLESFEPLPAPLPGEGYQLYMPPFRIEPGTEREVFYARQITDAAGQPLREDIFVNKYEIAYPTGSHHFILYRLTEKALEDNLLNVGVTPGVGVNPQDSFRVLDPVNPQALGNFGKHRVFITGTQTGEKTVFQFPEGVALRLAGDTIFDLNAHFVNLSGTEAIEGEVYVNFYTIPPEAVEHEAVELFSANTDIFVPPGTTRVAKRDETVREEIERRGYDPNTVLNLVMITSHMHRHGELFEIFQMSTGSLLHRSVAYDDAPITVFDPPLVLGADDGITYECTHNNYDRDVPLTFGFTSEDEMAIIMGYYYPTTESVDTSSE
jgi:hypothetical protein